jgi:hypothetical protein
LGRKEHRMLSQIIVRLIRPACISIFYHGRQHLFCDIRLTFINEIRRRSKVSLILLQKTRLFQLTATKSILSLLIIYFKNSTHVLYMMNELEPAAVYSFTNWGSSMATHETIRDSTYSNGDIVFTVENKSFQGNYKHFPLVKTVKLQ